MADIRGVNVDLSDPAAVRDTDGDGVLDVDEAAWGLDPNNVDSDGDGATDGQELTYSTTVNNQTQVFGSTVDTDVQRQYHQVSDPKPPTPTTTVFPTETSCGTAPTGRAGTPTATSSPTVLRCTPLAATPPRSTPTTSGWTTPAK